MQNKKFKFAAILSTILLALSVLVSSINAVTPNGVSQTSSSAKFVGTENANSEISYTTNTNSKSVSPIASASSSPAKALTTASSPVATSSNNDAEDNPFVGNDSMVDEDSTSQGWVGKYQVTTHTTYGNDVVGLPEGNGIYPHFDVNDDIGKAYCYDWKIPAPDQPGTEYNGFKFYDGMKVAANKQKAAEVAAALMAGYHLDKTTNKWQMSAALQQEAQDGYNTLMSDYKNDDYTPDANDTLGSLIYNQEGDKIQLSPNYTLEDYEQDVTQSVIWKIGGADDSSADLANKTQLGRDLYAYAMSHPLDEQTAYSNDLKAVSQGSQLSANHPLTIDPTTLKSQTFSITGYNGEVGVQNLDPNVQVIDNATGKPTSGLLAGHTYYLKAKKLNTANKKNYFDLNYENLAESHYFSVEDLNAPSTDDNNMYQNMVNLATKSLNLQLNFVYQQSSSSLSVASSKSAVNSSIAKSSSVVVLKASSKKSSVVVSSSKASSKKSSAVASSSKVSSKGSSAVVSSSKASSKKSSVIVSSSKASSKKSSVVVSSSKASSKKSSSVVSSTELNKKPSVVLNLFVSQESVTNRTVTHRHHRKHHKKSSIASSSVVSSSKASSKKSSSVVSSSKVSSKKSSSVVSSSAVSSKKSSSMVSNNVASSKKSSSVISSSAVSSSVVNQTVESSVFTQSHHRHHHKHHKFSEESSVVLSKSAKTTVVSSSEQSAQVVSSSAQNTKVSSQSQKKAQNESSKKQAVVVAGNKNNSQHGVSSNQHGKGEGHGMPQTGEAATALVAVGVVLLATAGVVELRKNK